MAVKGEARSTRQAVAADATRHVIVNAAQHLFLERGYVATTIDDIAASAGVAVQTVYNSVGPKWAVLSGVIDHVAAGEDSPTPVPVFMRERTARARTGVGVIRVLVGWFTEVHGRAGPMLRVLRDATAVEPQIAELERTRAARRFRNYHEAGQAIADRGDLRAGMTIEEAAAVIWSLGNAEIYRFLVLEQGWSIDRYRRWLGRGLRAQLLTG